jgi:hypothetical protein
MSLRTCAADNCKKRFEPYSIDQVYCSHRCGTRMRVRMFRHRNRYGGDDDGGGGRQRRLFPKPLLAKAKPPLSERRPKQDALFPANQTDLLATLGGAVEYREDGSVSDKGIMSM